MAWGYALDCLIDIISTAIYILSNIRVFGVSILIWDILIMAANVLVRTMVKPPAGGATPSPVDMPPLWMSADRTLPAHNSRQIDKL